MFTDSDLQKLMDRDAHVDERLIQISTRMDVQSSQLESIFRQLSKNAEVRGLLQTELKINTEATQRIEKVTEANSEGIARVERSTEGLVTGFNNLSGAWATVEWLGKVAARIAWVLIPVGLIGGVALASWDGVKSWLVNILK